MNKNRFFLMLLHLKSAIKSLSLVNYVCKTYSKVIVGLYMNETHEIMKKAVAYYRVSREKQGESGLGLEAQQESVHLYIKARKLSLSKEFTEIESGKNNKRPVLQEALKYCASNKTLLIIAKLDRLGRNVFFISSLIENKTKFVAVDNPEATHLILHILAAFAQYEREQISSRTKAALAVAKKRGIILGKNGKHLARQNKKAADDFAIRMQPIIKQVTDNGFETIEAITAQLNKKKIPTFRKGGRWHRSTVFALLKRIKSL
ncbi:MAG: recombinase family protein [Ferruginibacter sp.]